MITPCLDCTEREAGCHAQCKRYKEWKEETDAEKAEIYKKKNADHVINGYIKTQSTKRIRQEHKWGR